MKKILLLSIIVLSIFGCQKQLQQGEGNPISQTENVEVKSSPVEQAALLTFTEYPVNPKFGKPSSTNYLFQVLDLFGSSALSVKLYERATGIVTYLPMTKIANYWTLTTQLSQNGWYDYRYVYTATNANISSNSYELCNTRTVFNAGSISSIRWMFGADGSSWSNRLGWKGSQESGGCGYGWQAPGSDHRYINCDIDDRFSEDWNRDCPGSGGTSDNGAELRSPLDGQVTFSGWKSGYGYCIDIKQVLSSGANIVFRVAHLQNTPPPPVNAWVKAGVTKIGNLGTTGNSTGPHAHCAFYSINGGCNTSEKFMFNAL